MPNFKNFRLLKTLNKSLFFFGGEGEGKEWGRGFNFTTGLSFPTIKLAKMYPHKQKVDTACAMKHKHTCRIVTSYHPSLFCEVSAGAFREVGVSNSTCKTKISKTR